MESRQKRCKNCQQFYDDANQPCRYHPGLFKTSPSFGEPVWNCCVALDNYKPSGYKFSRFSDHHHGCRLARAHVEDENYTMRVDSFALTNTTLGGQAYATPGAYTSPFEKSAPTEPSPLPSTPALSPHILEIPYFPVPARLQPIETASACARCYRGFGCLTKRYSCNWCGVVVCQRCCGLRPMPIIGLRFGQACAACMPAVTYELYLVQSKRWTANDRPTAGNYWAWLDYMRSINWAVGSFSKYQHGRDIECEGYRSPFSDLHSPVCIIRAPAPRPAVQPDPSPTPLPPTLEAEKSEKKESCSYTGPHPVYLPTRLLPVEKSETEAEPETPAGPVLIRAGDVEGVQLKEGLALIPHQVRPDQTLVGLALKYGVSAKQIRSVNRLADDKIITRKQLLIPLDPEQQIDWNFCLAPTNRRIQTLALQRRIQACPNAGPVTFEEADFYLSDAGGESELAFQKWQEDSNWAVRHN